LPTLKIRMRQCNWLGVDGAGHAERAAAGIMEGGGEAAVDLGLILRAKARVDEPEATLIRNAR
jgi:hypothetical protein